MTKSGGGIRNPLWLSHARRRSLVIGPLSSVICHLSFVICHLSFVICHLSFVICHLSSGLCNPPGPCHPPLAARVGKGLSYRGFRRGDRPPCAGRGGIGPMPDRLDSL